MITSLDQMVKCVLESGRKNLVAHARAHKSNSIRSLMQAVKDGFAEALLIGQPEIILDVCKKTAVNPGLLKIIPGYDEDSAIKLAVKLAKNGEAVVVMKGMVSTDKYLKAVMDKENGLMLPDAVLSYVCALELPAYHKLLFITDPAVLPYPNLMQKVIITKYASDMAGKFGVNKPKIALIGASEKASPNFHYSADYIQMCQMAKAGEFGDCIMDGPLDIFLACDNKSQQNKGLSTPVDGDADILIFPSLESCNPFYKSLMLFANGKLAGLLRGTTKPVILMSRNETEKSKYYCIALSCLMV